MELKVRKSTKKLASYSHRAATTEHPCCIPALGDSTGAGRIRLARAAKVSIPTIITIEVYSQKVFFPSSSCFAQFGTHFIFPYSYTMSVLHISDMQPFSALKSRLGESEAEQLVSFVKTKIQEEVTEQVPNIATKDFVAAKTAGAEAKIAEAKYQIIL